jgi:hypothetical protein
LTSNNSAPFVSEYLVRKYYAESTVRDGLYAPYRAMLHNLKTDEKGGQYVDEAIKDFLNDLPDRTPIKITIEVGTPRTDLPRWVLLEPNHYGPETTQNKETCEK